MASSSHFSWPSGPYGSKKRNASTDGGEDPSGRAADLSRSSDPGKEWHVQASENQKALRPATGALRPNPRPAQAQRASASNPTVAPGDRFFRQTMKGR